MTTKIEVRSTDSVEEAALRLYRAGLIRRGVSVDVATKAVAKGTSIQLKMRAFAEMLTAVFYNERALEDAQMPDTATGEDLVRLASLYGIEPLTGAGAAGDVVVTCSGNVTYSAGQELVNVKSGKRYRVVATQTVSTGDGVGVIGVDIGRATDLAAGETLTWVSPPGASASTCIVGIAGLTSGQDPDNDARLRARLLKRLQVPPGAGNWSQLRQWAEEASASVEAAYVYPAVHGPGTAHVAFTVEGNAANNYRRAAPAALVTAVQQAVLSFYPQPADVFVSTVLEAPASMAIKLGLPDPVGANGPGGGWLDLVPWPNAPSTSGASVTSVITSTRLVVNAAGTLSVGARIAIWDRSAMTFQHATVVAYSVAGASYTITLDKALPTIGVGAYVSPDAERLNDYAGALCRQVARLGPGQRTFDYGRQVRHPFISPEDPAAITSALLAAVQIDFHEMSTCNFLSLNGSASTAPNLLPSAANVLDQPPKLWVPSQIGFYKA